MKRRILLITTIVLAIVASVFAVEYALKKPPVAEINQAREHLAIAKTKHAAKYATKTYQKACTLYDSAMYYWNTENQRIILTRDYTKTRNFALEAAEMAQKALHQTQKRVSNFQLSLETDLMVVNQKIDYFDLNFSRFPLSSAERKSFSNCRMLYNEAKLSFNRSNYLGSEEKLEKAEAQIDKLNGQYKKIIEDYFENYRQWEKWVKQTITHSRKQKTTAIIVDKFARTCQLYQNGHLTQTFDCELGPNWIGDKMHQGDKSTPEGNYKITRKKTHKDTKYYKALLLNYPNDDDKKEFAELKKSGVLSARARIGNLIEIHGDGGKGLDWTEGCVALSNNDMDKLYKVCAEGTPVTIVGSVQPLSKILVDPQD